MSRRRCTRTSLLLFPSQNLASPPHFRAHPFDDRGYFKTLLKEPFLEAVTAAAAAAAAAGASAQQAVSRAVAGTALARVLKVRAVAEVLPVSEP